MARQQIPFCIFSLSSQTTAERVGGILVLSSPLLPRAPTSVGASEEIEFVFSEARPRSGRAERSGSQFVAGG